MECEVGVDGAGGGGGVLGDYVVVFLASPLQEQPVVQMTGLFDPTINLRVVGQTMEKMIVVLTPQEPPRLEVKVPFARNKAFEMIVYRSVLHIQKAPFDQMKLRWSQKDDQKAVLILCKLCKVSEGPAK